MPTYTHGHEFGPNFADERLNRTDIQSDPSTGVVKESALLQVTFNVGPEISYFALG